MRIKHLRADSLVARFLAWLAGVVFGHRRLFFYPQLALFAVSIIYTVKFLQFDTGRGNLVGANKSYHQNFLRFKNEFPTQDDLAVIVKSENAEKNRQFVERLGAKLEAEPKVFHNVFYKGDLKMLGPKALLFVPDEQMAELNQTLKDFNPFLTKFTRPTNLLSLFNMVCAQFRTAKQETNAANQSLVKVLPALERIITQATASLRRSGTPPSPGVTALFDPGEAAQRKIYITFDNGRIYLVSCQAPVEKLNSAAVVRLRQFVEENANRGAGSQRRSDRGAGAGDGRNGPIPEGHRPGRRGVAGALRAHLHLRLPRDRPAGQSDVLPDRRTGLHIGLCDAGRWPPQHSDDHVPADPDRPGH